MIIGIDMGHPINCGASSILNETTENRKIGKYLIEMLKNGGHTVVNCTVDDNNGNELKRRTSLANAQHLDLFISIHLDSWTEPSANGTTVYVKRNANDYTRNVAKRVNDAVSESCGFYKRGVKEENFYVLYYNANNAILIETCFVTNKGDADKLDCYKVAQAIYKAVTGGTVTSAPSTNNNTSNNTGKYLNLDSDVPAWRVYPLDKSPVVGNECGRLSPSKYGGLSYKVERTLDTNIYQITTSSFGTVKIYSNLNDGGSLTSSPKYGEASVSSTPSKPTSSAKYLNLKPHVNTWRVYPTSVSPVVGNECGLLAPATYGGLSYEILGTPLANVYTINTQSFGRVNIYAPRDNDSTITTGSPSY